MSQSSVPNYSEYSNVFLLDIYNKINRVNNPEKAAALDKEIRKRFELSESEDINPDELKKFLKVSEIQDIKSLKKLSKDEEKIKQGWIAGLVLGGISFFVWLIALLTSQSLNEQPFNPFGLVDIMLVFGLSYGVYLKSRTCITILTVYYFLSKMIEIVVSFPQGIFGVIGLAIFMTFFIRAMIGTFEYHNKKQRSEELIMK